MVVVLVDDIMVDDVTTEAAFCTVSLEVSTYCVCDKK